MIITPPFYLFGEAGKTLGPEGRSLDVLGIVGGTLKLRSLDADELTFSMRAKEGRVIPDDAQWLTLKDDAGQVLFSGIAKRSYQYPSGVYSFTARNIYQGLMETPLTTGDRAFVLYGAADLGETIIDLVERGTAAGLSIRAPDTMPTLYPVPKMAFRATSVAGALEDAMKWAPDTVTRMDYSTDPPTLRFYCRSVDSASVLNLDADGHKSTSVELTPFPEARALAVSFAYCRREGNDVVHYLVQSVGNDNAEANRKLSLYLSGLERSDMLVSEALTTAQKAVAMAQASVDAVGASIDAAAASAAIPFTWSSLQTRDSNLAAALVAQPGFVMSPGGSTVILYTGINWPPLSPYTGYATHYSTAVYLAESSGAAATGWYAIETGSFTAAELATAGATKATKYIKGQLVAVRGIMETNAGMFALEGVSGAYTDTGWTSGGALNAADADTKWRKYLWYPLSISVEAINMAPSAVAAAVKAAAAAGSSAFIQRAEFVEAPPDLAANYFARQNWTPYKGQIDLTPTAPNIYAPGSFINILGDNVPADWHTMACPVSEASIDLATRAATITIGPSPRMDFSSLVDRLRIPPEDNYEPG